MDTMLALHHVQVEQPVPVEEPRQSVPMRFSHGDEVEEEAPQTYRRAEPKVGRNDPCPCGSGKKYKQCHGRRKAA